MSVLMVILGDNVFSCASSCVRVANNNGLVCSLAGFCTVEGVDVASLEIGGLEAGSESVA